MARSRKPRASVLAMESSHADPNAPLPDYYNGFDKGDHWELWCKGCMKGWRLEKPRDGQDVRPGNTLHLLNHAYSHKPEAKRG